MSEKVRIIKKEPFNERVKIPKSIRVVFIFAVCAIFLSAGVYFSVKYFKATPLGGTASVVSPENNANNNTAEQISDKNLIATICRRDLCFWINREGIAFKESGKSGGNLVLSVDDKTSRDLKVGQVLLPPETLAELLFLRKKVSESTEIGLRDGETSDLNLADFDFITSEGWILKISTKENSYKTIETLKQALLEIKKTVPLRQDFAGLDYVDLRIDNKVFYKFK